MNYIAFDFTTNGSDQSEQLIALLSNENFDGFEETGNNLKAFIPEEIFNETAFNEIIELFKGLKYSKTIVENINWNQQWEQSFEPVVVDSFVAIRAGFHQPIINVKHEIIITPKMSFGTGHHATTHLVVQQMEGINFVGKTVLDFGTGTGILAILAEKLGAANIFAIDIDEWSIDNSKENIILNDCKNIIVEKYDHIPQHKKYDIILANINLNVITSNLSAIKSVASNNSTIILSGFLKENESALLTSILNAGFQHIATVQKGQWIVIEILNK